MDRRRRRQRIAAVEPDSAAQHATAAASVPPQPRRPRRKPREHAGALPAGALLQGTAAVPPAPASQLEVGRHHHMRPPARAAASVPRKAGRPKREDAAAKGLGTASSAKLSEVPPEQRFTAHQPRQVARMKASVQRLAAEQVGAQARSAIAAPANTRSAQRAQHRRGGSGAGDEPRKPVVPAGSPDRHQGRKRRAPEDRPAEAQPAEGEGDAAPADPKKRQRKQSIPEAGPARGGEPRSSVAASGPAVPRPQRGESKLSVGRSKEGAHPAAASNAAKPTRRDRRRKLAAHPRASSAEPSAAQGDGLAQPRESGRERDEPVACLTNDHTQPAPVAALYLAQPIERQRRQRQSASERLAGDSQQPAAAVSRAAQQEADDNGHVVAPSQDWSAGSAPRGRPAQTNHGGTNTDVAAPAELSEPVSPPHHSPRRIRAAAPLPHVERAGLERSVQALKPAAAADVDRHDERTTMEHDALMLSACSEHNPVPALTNTIFMEELTAGDCPGVLLPPDEMPARKHDGTSAAVSALPASGTPEGGEPGLTGQAPVAQHAEQRQCTARPQPAAEPSQPTAPEGGEGSPSAASDPVQAELLAALQVFEHSDAERRQFHEYAPLLALQLPLVC